MATNVENVSEFSWIILLLDIVQRLSDSQNLSYNIKLWPFKYRQNEKDKNEYWAHGIWF